MLALDSIFTHTFFKLLDKRSNILQRPNFVSRDKEAGFGQANFDVFHYNSVNGASLDVVHGFKFVLTNFRRDTHRYQPRRKREEIQDYLRENK